MKKAITIVASLLLLAVPLTKAESVSPDFLKSLKAAMKKEIDKDLAGKDVSSGLPQAVGEKRNYLSKFDHMRPDNESLGLEQMLPELNVYFDSEEVHQEAGKVVAALKKAREDKQTNLLAQVNTSLKQARDALVSAKKPEDLDDLLRNLVRLREAANGDPDPEMRRAASGINQAISFLKRWQEYLLARSNHDSNKAQQILRDLASYDTDLIPRSRLLAESQDPVEQEGRVQAIRPEQIDEIVAQAKTLEKLPEAIKQLRDLQSQSRGHSGPEPIAATLNTLTLMDRIYRENQAGLPTKLEGLGVSSQDAISPAITPLRVQLLMVILPGYLNVPSDLKPKADETVQSYLQRVIDESRTRIDGGLLTRVREAQRILTGAYQTTSEPQGLALVTAARNQETAGQYALAVVSYQSALKSGGDVVPAKTIGDRLSDIKMAHPAEYEEGMKLFLASPRPEYFGQTAMRGGNTFPPIPSQATNIPASSVAPSVPTTSPAPKTAPSANPR